MARWRGQGRVILYQFRWFPLSSLIFLQKTHSMYRRTYSHTASRSLHSKKVGGHVAFEIGDKVIYPNHGLGVIERIETKTIMGTTCGFYQLRMAGETTVFVPVNNVDGVGLRRAVTDDEVQRLFNLLGDGKIDNQQ